jgi:type II secretory pathway component GspD/PulD (secretin)
VGQSVSVPQRQVVQSPWHTQVIESTQYRDVNSGFYVRPRLNGDRVTLEISTQNDAVEGSSYGGAPAVRAQQVTTTVSGRLGEWMVLGGTLQQGDENTSTIGSHTTSSKQERRNVLLKVEELN